MNGLTTLLTAFLLLFPLTARSVEIDISVTGTSYFVSSTGSSDSNPGTFALPFATVAHAQSVVRTALAGNASQDIVVNLIGNNASNAHVSFVGSISANTLTVSSVSSGTLRGGDILGGVTGRPEVVAFGTGSGTTGTYTVSGPSRSVSSASMTGFQPLLYTQSSTLTFSGADSPANGFHVVWQSYPGTYAGIAGNVPVAGGSFSLCTTGDVVCNGGAGSGTSCGGSACPVYVATVSSPSVFRELYVNGIHATRARGPGTWTGSGVYPSGWSVNASTGVYTAPSNSVTPTSSWTNVTDIEVASQQGWQTSYCPIASISGTTITMQAPCVTNWVSGFAPQANIGSNTPAWIENAYELLPSCGYGCFYMNRNTSQLYYIPRAQESLATADVQVPAVQQLITGSGVANVTFQQLAFEYSTWTDPSVGGFGYIEMQNGYHCPSTPPANCINNYGVVGLPLMGALDFSGGTNNVTLSHNVFAHLSGRPVFFEHASQHNNVLKNLIFDNAGAGVQIGDVTDYAESSPSLQTSHNTVQNNEIQPAFEYLSAGGVFVPIATNTLIDHNYLPNNSWAGITTGWWGWQSLVCCNGHKTTYNADNTISNNYEYFSCLNWPMEDCAAIYNNGNQTNLQVTGNYLYGAGGGQSGGQYLQGCWFPDESSTAGTWTSNVCDVHNGSGVRYVFIWTSTITTQTVTGNWTTTSSFLDNGTGDTISGNTQYTSGSPPAGAAAVIANAGLQSGVSPGL